MIKDRMMKKPTYWNRVLRMCSLLALIALLAGLIPHTYAAPTTPEAQSVAPAVPQQEPSVAVAPTIEPDELSGNILWLDAGDPDADGNPGNNPSDGTVMPVWVDKSGAGNNATTLGGHNAGTFRSAAAEQINSHPVVHFTRQNANLGSVYNVAGVDIRAGALEDVTILTVYRPTTASGGFDGLWGVDDGAWDRFFLSYAAVFGDGVDDGLVSLGPAQMGAVVPDAGKVGVVRLMTAVYNGAVSGTVNSGPTNGSAIYFDGQVVTRFTDSTHPTAAQTSFRLGWDGDGNTYNGDIAEVIIYNRVLNGCELYQINSYLGAKYGKNFSGAAPGGVLDAETCDLHLWLKADAGTSGTGTAVSTWSDLSPNGVVANAVNPPTRVINGLNFNPTVDFDGFDDHMIVSGGILGTATYSDVNIFMVSKLQASGNFVFREGLSPTVQASRLSLHVPWSNGQVMWDAGGSTPPNRLTATWGSQAGEPNLWSFLYSTDQTDTGYKQDIVRDGTVIASDDDAAAFTGIGQDLVLGSGGIEAAPYNGEIAELIMYRQSLTAGERNRIESYLAIKYGITLDDSVDYTSSSGALLYPTSSGGYSAYPNDITVVGRDDASGLLQVKSKSINPNTFVTLGVASGSFTDGEFLAFGDDGESAAYTRTIGSNQLMGRTWKVRKTATTFNVVYRISLPTSMNATKLMMDTDGTCDFTGTGAIAFDLAADGAEEFRNLNFGSINDATCFTFAQPAPLTAGPGGVTSNVGLWLKANQGVSASSGQVSSWTDQSTNAFVATADVSPTLRPMLSQSSINFNPTVDFDGDDDLLTIADGVMGTQVYSDMNVFVVANVNTVQNSFLFRESLSGAGARISAHLPYGSGLAIWDAGSATAPNRLLTSWGSQAGTPNLWSMLYSTGATDTTHKQDIVRNGAVLASDDDAAAFTGAGADMTIASGEGMYYDADIAEMVFYTGPLTAAQRNRIESYLAAKYGLTLASNVNYTASDGTVFYPSTSTHSGYVNNITAVGRDDGSVLTQNMSKSINTGTFVTLAVTGTALSNMNFVAFGDNNQATTFTRSIGDNDLMQRSWKLKRTGSIPPNTQMELRIPASMNADLILFDNDGNCDFTGAGSVALPLVAAGAEERFMISAMSLADGACFTFAKANDHTAPPAPSITTPMTTISDLEPLVGTAEPNAIVTVTLDLDNNLSTTGDQIVYVTTTNASGSWMVDVDSATPVSGSLPGGRLPRGRLLLQHAQARDAAGNVGSASTRTVFVRYLNMTPLLHR